MTIRTSSEQPGYIIKKPFSEENGFLDLYLQPQSEAVHMSFKARLEVCCLILVDDISFGKLVKH